MRFTSMIVLVVLTATVGCTTAALLDPVKRLDCSTDNCLRALSRNKPAAESFCASYITEGTTEITGASSERINAGGTFQDALSRASPSSRDRIWLALY